MTATNEAAMTEDGRRRRRERNIQAVRATILDMLETWETPTLGEVAQRSGVTVRSIYRYHEDLDAAVVAACESRIAELVARFGEYEPISVDDPFHIRVDLMVQRRLEMERLSRPLRHASPNPEMIGVYDSESRRVFEPELARFSDVLRDAAGATVSHLLRPPSIRSLLEPEDDARRASATLRFALHRILLGEVEDVAQRLN